MDDAELIQLRDWLSYLHWKSVDADNMEFEVRTTCFVKDLLDKFAKEGVSKTLTPASTE